MNKIMKTSKKVLKAAAIASLLAGGAVAGSFINAESAQADPQSSKVSGALTSVLSNGVTNSFAAEVVLPQESIASTGAVTMNVTYSAVGDDASQLAITTANMNAGNTTYEAQTVEAATARAIDTAAGTGQFGDVNGIVKSFQSGGLD